VAVADLGEVEVERALLDAAQRGQAARRIVGAGLASASNMRRCELPCSREAGAQQPPVGGLRQTTCITPRTG
jgi:hypothetical protein